MCIRDRALPVEEALHSATVEVLKAAVSDPALDEDLALALSLIHI